MPATENGYRCDVCGRFCKKISSSRHKARYRCPRHDLIFVKKTDRGTDVEMEPGDGEWPVTMKDRDTYPDEWGWS